MNQYYATFIPGLQEVVAEIVRERLNDVTIHKLLDGAALFETSLTYDKLNFLCFNNIFASLGIMECSLEAHINSVIHDDLPPAAKEIIAHNSKKFRTFRIVVSRENTPAAIDEALRRRAEQYIAGISGLKVDRARPDAEFWFLYRGEGFSLFMKRLTMRPSWEKSLHPGELPPPLAWILCRLANLQYGDVVLDPFCGYGSIPQAALKYFHIRQCIACDTDTQAAAYTAGRFNGRSGDFVFHKADFRSLPSLLPEHSIDAIITDPPWGHYQGNQAVPTGEMFDIFDTLLKPEGRMVILGARNEEWTNAARGSFVLHKAIPILLSGKKAAVYLYSRS